eukprot:TRINITY_DN3354_c0_g2_i8.p1 TRINITY_DN3354_c0_g2~~TRINITY_DN3354_c0_g2_i8.p1  ORF type:complete len:159 (+),score=87.10 TRINITY_DN3354_c0_g2_i8:46-477(+)
MLRSLVGSEMCIRDRDKKEFATMVRSLGQTPSNMELDQAVNRYAPDGKIDLVTAKQLLEDIYACTEKRGKDKLADAFQVFDPEHTGKIPFDLFKNEILTKIGEPMEEQELADTLANLESSGARDGDDIKYAVFVDWIWDQLRN